MLPRALALRYARQVLLAAPTAAASRAQWASAPGSPPRFAPSPVPTLVMKKFIVGCACCGAWALRTSAAAPSVKSRIVRIWTGPRVGVGPARTGTGSSRSTFADDRESGNTLVAIAHVVRELPQLATQHLTDVAG